MTAHQIDPLSVSLICHVQLHPRRRAFQHHEWANSFAFPLFPRSIGSRSCVTNDSSLPQLIPISVAWSNQESKSTARIFNYYLLHGILISTISRLTPEIRKVSVKVRQLLPRKIQWQPIALLYIYIYIYIYILCTHRPVDPPVQQRAVTGFLRLGGSLISASKHPLTRRYPHEEGLPHFLRLFKKI